MTNPEFALELLKRASDARRALCGARKTRILAEAQVRMAAEDVACLQQIVEWERQAVNLNQDIRYTAGVRLQLAETVGVQDARPKRKGD